MRLKHYPIVVFRIDSFSRNKRSALSLLVSRIDANNVDLAFTLNDFAILANSFHTSLNFHNSTFYYFSDSGNRRNDGVPLLVDVW